MAKDDLSGKLAVILHADVAGSTQLVQQDEQLAHERIRDAFRHFSETIEKYHGRVQELRGDALLAEFERASDAVTAALSFQYDHTDHLVDFNDDIRPEIRVGIALGEVVIADRTVTGAGVVLAQRVEQLAQPGGLCITSAIHEALPNRLPFIYESLGEQDLKGFEDPVRVYRVQLDSDEAVPQPQQKIRQPAPPNRLLRTIIGAALLVVAGIGIWNKISAPREEPASIERMAFPLPDKPSIAVLPFTNMSGDPKQEYFTDGMTENLITDLSKLSGLFVIARNSSFSYKGQQVKVRQVAEDLGVRYVMEGSVQRAGDQVRINAQLIDATTGGHLWAERYDGTLSDIFALQDRVTSKIVNAMSVTLTPQELEDLGSLGTSNVYAHDAYLQGLSFYLRNTPPDNAKAEAHFKRAVELDPDFKRAYTALAKVYFRGNEPEYADAMGKFWRTSIFLAYKNLAKSGDINFADTHVVRSHMAFEKHQVDVALSEAERALDLSINDVDALQAKARALIFSGQYAEGRKIANLVLRLDPAVPANPLYLIGLSYLAEGSYEKAVDYIERAREYNPTTIYFAGALAAAYGKLGKEKEAKQAFSKYQEGWIARAPTISQVVYDFPFQDGEVLKHLADGFGVAGVREGFGARYLKLNRETRLSGQEIKSLLFGHTIKGRDYWRETSWTQVRTTDGKVSHRGQPIHTGSGITKEGESWIEDDRVCGTWSAVDVEINICALIFRDSIKCWKNNEGQRRCGEVVLAEYAQRVQNNYYMVTDQGAHRFQVLSE